MNEMTINAPWNYGFLSRKDDDSYLYNGEHLFFWMGDTAWLIFHKLKWEEIKLYLRNRAEKGFNVIQMVLVHHLPAVNAYGRQAFVQGDLRIPDVGGEHAYWKLVDETITEAERLGMYCALFPHWGSLAEVFSMEEMGAYTQFLIARYHQRPNVIWVTGGDIRGNEKPEYWKKMGCLLKEGCKEHLVTFHPFGRTSSIDYFPEEPWMDFHMFQSGHRRYDQVKLGEWDDAEEPFYGEDNWRYVKDGASMKKKLPILDAEPSYEHIPQGLHLKDQPYWNKEQIRRYAWWSVLSGACGFTYGHNSIMQFYEGSGEGAFHVKLSWLDALHAPGCDAMVHMKELLHLVLSKRDGKSACAEALLAPESAWAEEQRQERIMAYRAGNFLLCYTYTGKTIAIDGEKTARMFQADRKSSQLEWYWMYPESGVKSYGGTVELRAKMLRFCPPAGDDTHRDWVLIVEVKAG